MAIATIDDTRPAAPAATGRPGGREPAGPGEDEPGTIEPSASDLYWMGYRDALRHLMLDGTVGVMLVRRGRTTGLSDADMPYFGGTDRATP